MAKVTHDGDLDVKGALTVPGDATTALQAVPKQQLDALPELASSDPTKVSLSTAGGVTTMDVAEVSAKTKTINAQTGTAYTLALADVDKIISLDNAAAITLTFPQDSAAAIPVGSRGWVYQKGAGAVTTAAGTGATILGSGATYSAGHLSSWIKSAANTFVLESANQIVTGGIVVHTAFTADPHPEYQLEILNITGTASTAIAPVVADKDKFFRCTAATAITVTLPSDATSAVVTGSQFNFVQNGAGQITFAAGASATVNATPGLKTRAQYSVVTAIKTAANTWLLTGDLAA